MRASIIFSTIALASAAFAAPVVNELVSTITNTVEKASGGIVRRVDLGDAGVVLSEVESTVDPIVAELTSSLKERDLLDLGDILGTVSDLLQTVLSTVTTVEGDLSNLLNDIENVNVDAILSDVEGDVQQLINLVQQISNQTGLGLQLGSLNPLVNLVSGEVTSVLSIVENLLNQGLVNSVLTTIKGELGEVLSILSSLGL